MRRVVVTGLGVVSPVGCGPQVFWDRLTGGASGIKRIDRFDTSEFASQIAGQVSDFNPDEFVPAKEQRRMDLFSIYAMAAARMAVNDSGLALDKLDLNRCGVAVSAGIGGIAVLEREQEVLRTKGPRRVSPFCVPMMITNMPAGLIAIDFQFGGPNYAVVTACASALHSIGFAFRGIRCGDADVMIAGGTEATITPLSVSAFAAMRALSTRNDDPLHASRPFDKERDGFVIGEGSGILLLEEYEHAVKRGARIYAEVAGFGMSCDAFHITAPRDDGDGAKRAMALAMADAGLNPGDIDYVNAHGTSTPLNDKIETLAIKGALGEAEARRVMISSTKSMTGHLLGAAGGFESAVCAKVFETGVIPPTVNYTTPDPECDLDYVPNQAREVSIRACLNNSLGFGGHNACVAFKRI